MTPKVPDYGHRYADKKLVALLRRLRLSYLQASISLQQKIDDYMEQFEKEDAYKRALYDSGELSHKDFLKWRKKEIIETKAWRDMLNQLADDITHQNQIAASMIDDTLPDVYALNHNYGTFEAEKGSGYDTTYTLYDKHTVKRLLTEHEDLLPHPSVPIEKDKLWNKQHLQSAVLQGILTGEPMSDIAKRFQSVTDMTERAAMRNARTAVTGAENAGRIDSYIRAQNMGIKMKQMWMATLDGRTRDSHAIMDGEQQEVGKKFSNGCRYPGDPQGSAAEVYNCFIGETKIATDSEIIRSYKHDYSGELVTIKTARGVEFTCTPNHPIFTPLGWVGANTLHKGDDVCITFVGDNHLAGSNPNIDHIFTRIDAIHEFFEKFGSKRIRSLGVNFHGDIPTSDVEIVTHKRFLKDNRYTVIDETGKKFFFKSSNKSFMSKCSFSEHLRRIWFSTLCFMSRLRKALSFFWSRMCHTSKHCFRTISGSDPVLSQTQSDNGSGNVQFSGDGFDRPSCAIFADNIIDVKISSVRHIPVYNLQTNKNYYFVSSIIPDFSEKYNDIPMVIAHNCRCTTVAIVEGADPYNPNLRPSEYLKKQGLTYEQWKEMHGERFYSKLFKDYEEPSENPVAMHHIVNGNDISQTWQRRKDQFAFAIEDVINAQGFDGLPQIVSDTEFYKAVGNSNIIMQRAYCAETKEILEQYRKELYTGKWYVDCSVGGDAYGKGMYTAYNTGTELQPWTERKVNIYTSGHKRPYGYIETMTLSPDAKIITHKYAVELKYNIKEEWEENREKYTNSFVLDSLNNSNYTDFEKAYIADRYFDIESENSDRTVKWYKSLTEDEKSQLNKKIESDVKQMKIELYAIDDFYASVDEGTASALFGYDAVMVGDDSGELVVLNRTKVIFRKDTP